MKNYLKKNIILTIINSSVSFGGFNTVGFTKGKRNFNMEPRNSVLYLQRQMSKRRKRTFYYLLGLRNFNYKKKVWHDFLLYQGQHLPKKTFFLDVVLPGVSYLEQVVLILIF